MNSSEVLETLLLAGNLADGAARSVDEASWRTVRPVSEGESRSIAKRYKEGLTVPQLVVATGRNRATVLRHLHQRGVETRHPGRKLTDEQVAAAADRYRRGETIKAIAGDLPVHKETLRKELVRAGVELRSGRFGRR